MFTIHKPTFDVIRQYIGRQQNQPFSYAAVGATRNRVPTGFQTDRHRVLLGHGETVFQRAKAAMRTWQMFPEAMVELCWPNASIEPGTIVAALFRAIPFWTLNPCCIVYTIDETGPTERYGFAYGTLMDHLECGEERFTVEWKHADNRVWYELYCFSRPRHPLARLGYPYVRLQQRRFRQLSGSAMQRAVTIGNGKKD